MTESSPTARFCRNCGNAATGSRFCSNCGADLASPPATQIAPQLPPTVASVAAPRVLN